MSFTVQVSLWASMLALGAHHVGEGLLIPLSFAAPVAIGFFAGAFSGHLASLLSSVKDEDRRRERWIQTAVQLVPFPGYGGGWRKARSYLLSALFNGLIWVVTMAITIAVLWTGSNW